MIKILLLTENFAIVVSIMCVHFEYSGIFDLCFPVSDKIRLYIIFIDCILCLQILPMMYLMQLDLYNFH